MQWMNLPMLSIYRLLPLLFLLMAWSPLNAQRTWSFELHGGVTANMPLPLTIIQQNYPIIYFKQARYYSEPLKSPYYWDWRFAKWFGKHSIEFEAIHIEKSLASVWTPYKFYLNGKVSHTGTNSFQLVKTAEGWKIQYIIDTRRRL